METKYYNPETINLNKINRLKELYKSGFKILDAMSHKTFELNWRKDKHEENKKAGLFDQNRAYKILELRRDLKRLERSYQKIELEINTLKNEK